MLSDQNKAVAMRELSRHGMTLSHITTISGRLHLEYFGLLDAMIDAAREEGRQPAGDRVSLEALAEAIDPDAWKGGPISTRADTITFHERRQASNEAARRVAALLSPQAAPVEHIADLGKMVPANEQKDGAS